MSDFTQEALSVIKVLPYGATIIISCFILFVIIPTLLSILEKVINLFDRKKSIIDKLREAVNELPAGAVKNSLEEELEMQYFRAATGLYLERAFREKVVEIYRLANGQYDGFRKASPKLTFKHFERAHHYLLFDGNEIEVNIPNWHIWKSKVSLVVGYILFFFAAFICLLPLIIYLLNAFAILEREITLATMVPFLFLGFSLAVLSVITFGSTFSVQSAINIKNAIHENKKEV